MKLFAAVIPALPAFFLDENSGCESMWKGQDSTRGDPSCYQVWCFSFSTVTWEEAKILCNSKVVDFATAHLVSVDTPEVNDLVCNILILS